MAKKIDKKEEDFIEDDILDETEEIDEVEDLEDDLIEDDIEEDDIEEDVPSKKNKKSKKTKGKKKSKAKVIIGIVAAVLVVAVAVFAVGYFLLGWFSDDPIIAGAHDKILKVNGYQQNIDVSTVSVRSDSEFDSIVSVNDMLSATGLSLSDSADTTEIAANIYNLAVTNYADVNGTGWYCYTDSSVFAKDVDATLGLKFNFPSFNVGVRACYAEGSQESKDPDLKAAGVSDFFSQTISGVTVLDIDGLPSNLTDTLKKMFGYNIQKCLYDGTFAFRRGSNGGAQFYGDDDELGYKYLMGAYNKTFEVDCIKLKEKKEANGGWAPNTFYMHEYDPEIDNVSQKLDYIETPANVIKTRPYAWSPLNTYYDYAYSLTPYTTAENYYCGNYGNGWAVYDLSKENLDSSTTVTYDSRTHVYTLNIVVKEDKADAACMFAKGSLTKDTKDYIQMQNAKYTITKNTIEVFENGLIKSWDREETVSSTEKAKLTILTGDCNDGGGTTNKTFMAFSYADKDHNPLALAAIYWPQLGQSSVVGSTAFDLSSYDDFDSYVPEKNQKTSLLG